MKKIYIFLLSFVFIGISVLLTSCGSGLKFSNSINNTFSSSPKYIYLNDLIDGVALDRVKKSSVKEFFERIASNKTGDSENWKVVFVSTYEVYYGIIKTAPNGEKILNPAYSVDKDLLTDAFPIYENTDGVNIKSKIYYTFLDQIVETKVKPYCDKRFVISYPKYDIKLAKSNTGINANLRMNVKCYDYNMLDVIVKTTLDKSTLDPIKQKVDTVYYKSKN